MTRCIFCLRGLPGFSTVLVCLSAALCCPSIAHPAEVPGNRPNIVWIMADDLGYGELGCYGQQEIHTPNIDRLAAEGMRFTQCYSGSTVCAPSRGVLMTGKHAGHATVRGNGVRVENRKRGVSIPLGADEVTVGELLQQAGYATGVTGKWGLGAPGSEGLPNDQGFDDWLGFLSQRHAHGYYPEFIWHNRERKELPGNLGGHQQDWVHDRFTDFSLEFIDQNHAKPFFLYVAYTAPHGRYETPDDKPYSEKPWPQDVRNYAAIVTRMDSDVGRIVKKLADHGLDDRTLIFFTSDNGAETYYFRKKDQVNDYVRILNPGGELRGFKRDLTEGGIRVPCIARWPGKIEAGQVEDRPWAFWDLLPTAADLAGVTPPADVDGHSIVPTLLGKKQPPHAALYWEFYERGFQQAVRMDHWKGLRLKQGQPLELYDLRMDLSETNNVADRHPDVVRQVEEVMAAEHSDSPYWPKLTVPIASLGDASQLESRPDPGVRVPARWKFNGTLRVHPGNSRYFTDDSGRVIYLTGSHTWLNLVSGSYPFKTSPFSLESNNWVTARKETVGDPDARFDFDAYLDLLERHDHNFIRGFNWESVRWVMPDDTFVTYDLNPYQRTGPGEAADGSPKFDVTKFNPAYFDQIRDRVKRAHDRGMYISVMLFEGFSVAKKNRRAKSNHWDFHPFHRDNNVNGLDGDPNGDSEGYETHTLEVTAITRRQEEYTRQMIRAVGEFDNVLFEISNESHGGSIPWQHHMIEFIRDVERLRPKQHPIWMTYTWDPLHPKGNDDEGTWASSAEAVSPGSPAETTTWSEKHVYRWSPLLADGSKVVIADTDHIMAGDHHRRNWMWKAFMRGANTIFMDDLTILPHIEATRAAMGHTRWYAEKINLAAMIPIDDPNLCSTGYCLIHPGREYLVFQPEVDSIFLKVDAGEYRFEWFDPKAGKVVENGKKSLTSGINRLQPPIDGAAVLHLVRESKRTSGFPDGHAP